MQVHPEVYATAEEVGLQAASAIADGIEAAVLEERPFVLGCPSGRSPMTTYRSLAELVSRRQLSLSHVIIALMDEYVVKTGGEYRPISDRLPHSCVGFARREIIRRLNAVLPAERRIPPANLWHPDPAAAEGDYDSRLKAAGGIDVFLLASGASDGHIALNPVGSAADSVTRVVALRDDTRRDNLHTFPTLSGIDDVPRYGVTVGIASIRDLSRSVVMVVTGRHKQATVQRLAAADSYQPDWPATVLSDCARPRFLADRDAALLLQPST